MAGWQPEWLTGQWGDTLGGGDFPSLSCPLQLAYQRGNSQNRLLASISENQFGNRLFGRPDSTFGYLGSIQYHSQVQQSYYHLYTPAHFIPAEFYSGNGKLGPSPGRIERLKRICPCQLPHAPLWAVISSLPCTLWRISLPNSTYLA